MCVDFTYLLTTRADCPLTATTYGPLFLSIGLRMPPLGIVRVSTLKGAEFFYVSRLLDSEITLAAYQLVFACLVKKRAQNVSGRL